MASKVGDQILELKRDESEEVDSFYKIKTYQAKALPLEYTNLIIGPFLNSLRYGNDLYKLIDKEAYFLNYSKYIESLLQRPRAMIKLSELSDGTVLGWSFYEENIVHYIWVKKEVRRQGIAKALMPKQFDTISHITNKGINIWVSKFPNVRFNPFA